MANSIPHPEAVFPAHRAGTRRAPQPSTSSSTKRSSTRSRKEEDLEPRVDALLADAELLRFRDPAATLRLASEAQMLSRGSAYEHGLTGALRLQGLCDIDAGYLDRARDLLAEAVTLCEASGRTRDDNGAARSLLGLGSVLLLQGQSDDALEVLERSIRRAHRSGNRSVEGEALALQAECHLLQGDAGRGMDHLERGMAIVDELGDPTLRAVVLLSAARVRRSAGAPSRAMLVVRRGRRIATEEGLHRLVCVFDLIAAVIRVDVGDDPGALREYTAAAACASSLEAHAVMMECAAGIAGIHRRAGDDRAAIEWTSRRIDQARHIGSRHHEASALNTLGNLHYRLGDLQEALSAYTEALVSAGDAGRIDIEEICLENLGNVHRDMGHHKEAIGFYGRSRRIASSRKNRSATASCYYNLGLLDLDRADYAAAIQHLNTAAIAAEGVGDRSLLADAHHELSRAYEGRNESDDIKRAFEHFRRFHRWREADLVAAHDRQREQTMARAEIERSELEEEMERLRTSAPVPVADPDESSRLTTTVPGLQDTEQGNGPVVIDVAASIPEIPVSKKSASTRRSRVSAKRTKEEGVVVEPAEANDLSDRNVEILKREIELREVEAAFIEGFVTRHPTISPGELRVLLFLRTGMTTPEISAFLGVTERAVEKHRYKIRRKLELPTHVNLADYARSFGM